MKTDLSVRWITRTAVFIALLVVSQIGTAPLGNTLITGSAVNLLLIVSVATCGLMSGAAVSLLSPVLARLLGIGPLWSLIPFIMAGNLSLVTVWHIIAGPGKQSRVLNDITAAATAAAAKFIVLYYGIVRLAVPVLLKLPEKQAVLISGMFSAPQLVTALTGGAIAVAVLPALRRSLGRC